MERLGVPWRGLAPDQRRWIVLNALVGAAVVNLVINAGLAWWGVRDSATVAAWAVPAADRTTNMILDTAGTCFFLPFLTCVSCTKAIGDQRRRGRVSGIHLGDLGSWLRRLPEGRWWRGVVIGAACTAALSPLAALALVGVGDMSRASFVAYKAILGVTLGAVVTPLVALRAMADPVLEPVP